MRTLDSLENFVLEMRDSANPERFLKILLSELAEPPIPTLDRALTGYDHMSNLHGIKYDYDVNEVYIEYRVVSDLYEPKKVSFAYFEAVLEGILVCRRKKKW